MYNCHQTTIKNRPQQNVYDVGHEQNLMGHLNCYPSAQLLCLILSKRQSRQRKQFRNLKLKKLANHVAEYLNTVNSKGQSEQIRVSIIKEHTGDTAKIISKSQAPTNALSAPYLLFAVSILNQLSMKMTIEDGCSSREVPTGGKSKGM